MNVAPAVIPVAGSSAVTPLGVTDSLFLGEKAAAEADIAAKGQFWVRNDTPCVPMFTDDAGTDTQLGVAGGGVTIGAAVSGGGANQLLFEDGSNNVGSSANLTYASGVLKNVAADATTVGQIIEGAAAQSVDIAQFNPNGVTAGESARVTSAGEFSNTAGLSLVERFGAGAAPNVSGASNLIAGGNAAASLTSGNKNTLLGSTVAGALNSGIRNVIIGDTAGYGISTGIDNVIIGQAAGGTNLSETIQLGYNVQATANNQFVAGGNANPIDNVFFGKGVTNATATNWQLNGTGGSGTNNAGAGIVIATGPGTGTALPGSITIKAAPGDAGSGTTLNDVSETVIEVTANATVGELGFFGATPVIKQAGTGETTGFTAGAGTAVNDDSTFTGNVGATAYRISDIVKALKNYGLLTS